jgi:hypothetical protein
MPDLEVAARGVVNTWAQGNLAQAVCELDRCLQDQDRFRREFSWAVDKARQLHDSDDAFADVSPLVAPAEEGVYVSVWLWVPNPS